MDSDYYLSVPATRVTRKQSQEQTRAALLRAAAELFAANGVEGTSLEAIARHAGLTQGAIYSNFSGKADIWWAIAGEMSRVLTFEDHIDGEKALEEQLGDLGCAVWELLQSMTRNELVLTREFDLFLARNPREHARYKRGLRAGHRRLADNLARAADGRKAPLPMPSEQLARSISAVVEGLLHLYILDDAAVDEDLCVATMRAMALPRKEGEQ